jgi:hypothetical protein
MDENRGISRASNRQRRQEQVGVSALRKSDVRTLPPEGAFTQGEADLDGNPGPSLRANAPRRGSDGRNDVVVVNLKPILAAGNAGTSLPEKLGLETCPEDDRDPLMFWG